MVPLQRARSPRKYGAGPTAVSSTWVLFGRIARLPPPGDVRGLATLAGVRPAGISSTRVPFRRFVGLPPYGDIRRGTTRTRMTMPAFHRTRRRPALHPRRTGPFTNCFGSDAFFTFNAPRSGNVRSMTTQRDHWCPTLTRTVSGSSSAPSQSDTNEDRQRLLGPSV